MRCGYAFASLAALVVTVNAQASEYAQCGGTGWAGATTCVAPYTCVELNAYYSQCLPGAASSSASVPSSTPGSTSSVTPTITPTVTSTVASTTTSSGATPTGSQIRSDQDPVYHFYLQNQDGVPILGPEDTSGYFVIDGTIALSNATDGSILYLNVDESASASYKPLTLNTTATTTDWGLEGDTIITTDPRQLNFLVCSTSDPNVWSLYLQEGNDTPSDETCTNDISLHLPCLC